ncbi:hypothetical protein MPL3365_30685 [Mesorhizobium plurifarium]|uniref:Uncharacterized protein n=1 Tax=Mesorhizobium plurifarium TaxID=69974 RepID=A0A090G8L0_MESPL|nr:hypothetical protein MPL3365_30685 [Mesorhizobium plurifarium]
MPAGEIKDDHSSPLLMLAPRRDGGTIGADKKSIKPYSKKFAKMENRGIVPRLTAFLLGGFQDHEPAFRRTDLFGDLSRRRLDLRHAQLC